MSTSQQIIALSAYTFRIRIAQIILAILIAILNIVSSAILGGYGVLGYGIFTPIATCIIVTYWYLANYTRRQSYNRWAILVLDCFGVVWWLSLWSALANLAVALGVIDSIDNEFGVSNNTLHVLHALTAVTAVLGAAEFILFVVSLVSFSILLHRARQSEHQMGQQGPFPNTYHQPTLNVDPNQQMNGQSATKLQGLHSDGGVEVAP